MPESPSRLPVPFVSLNITKPLFDNHGNEHSFVVASPFQVLTTYRGLFFVWDGRSGESLMRARQELRLSNEPPPQRASHERVTEDDRLQMRQATSVIEFLRRSSRAELAARARAASSDGTQS